MLDSGALADCEYTVIQRFGSDGGFIEGMLVCETPSSRTVFLPPGSRLNAAETEEIVLSWSVAQWLTQGASDPEPPTGIQSEPIRPAQIEQLLPHQLKDWVRQASATSLGVINFLAKDESDQSVLELLGRKRRELLAWTGELPARG